MLSHVAILAVSLAALVKGAELLVEHAARLARRFQVSDLVVGLVITSLGTSLPELSFALAASLAGSPGLVIGNVVGSNIANIGLVLGVAAVIRPFATDPKMHDRDGFIVVAGAVALFAMSLDNLISPIEGLGLLVLYVLYIAFATRSDRSGVEARFKDFLTFMFDFEYAKPVVDGLARRRRPARSGKEAAGDTPGAKGGSADERERRPRDLPLDRRGAAREGAVVALSLAVIIVSSRYVVAESVSVARIVGVPEDLIGLSLLALGTSLPELLIAITAARAGNAEMVVGNVMGSNIANGMLIIGLAGIVRPLRVPELSVIYTMPIMLFFSLALLHFVRSDWRISRAQGLVAVFAYVAFLATAFLQGWS